MHNRANVSQKVTRDEDVRGLPRQVHNNAKLHQSIEQISTCDRDEPDPDLIGELQERDEDIGPVLKKLQKSPGEHSLSLRGEYLWRIRKKLLVRDGVLIRLQRVKAGLEPIEQVVTGCPTSMSEEHGFRKST